MTAGDDLHLLAVAVARMEGKLDSALASNVDHEARLRSLEQHNTKDHDDRIAKLERWRWVLTGAAAAAGAGAGTTLSALLKLGH